MSYILPSLEMGVLHLKSFTSMITAGGQVMKFASSQTQVGQVNSTYSSSTGQTVLPNSPCILAGSLAFKKTAGTNAAFYADVQWYDVSNSQYIGSIGRTWGYRPSTYYGSYDLTCDEEAIAVAQNITVELRIIGKGGTQTLVGDNDVSYSSASRAIIMEFT
jgi:hypothetical protein